MKTLKQLFREITDQIFPSFSEEHREHLNLMFRQKTKEWIEQKRQEIGKADTIEEAVILVKIDKEYEKLLEELNQ